MNDGFLSTWQCQGCGERVIRTVESHEFLDLENKPGKRREGYAGRMYSVVNLLTSDDYERYCTAVPSVCDDWGFQEHFCRIREDVA